ncbi:hypothetical protein [Pedobacter sp. AJM]|nr:hypothetical protein [Pedobacter sp. AJM]
MEHLIHRIGIFREIAGYPGCESMRFTIQFFKAFRINLPNQVIVGG